MVSALKKEYLTSKEVQKILDEKGEKGDEWFAKKFKYILGRLDIDINYFKSKASEGGRGHIIFNAGEAPERIKEIFDIFKEHKEIMTLEDIRTVAWNLKGIMPVKRQKAKENKSLKFPHGMRGQNRKLEFLEEDLERSAEDPRYEIEYAVRKFYMSVIKQPSFFSKKIFVSIDGKEIKSKRIRAKIYKYQYGLVKKWCNKWSFIMETAEQIRIVEELDKLESVDSKEENCKQKQYTITEKCLCEYLIGIFESKVSDDADKKELEPKIGSRDGCSEKCVELVEKILSVSLKKKSKSDFNYMLMEASKELESIKRMVERKCEMEAYILQLKSSNRTENPVTGKKMDEDMSQKDIANAEAWKMLAELKKIEPRINVIEAQTRRAFMKIANKREEKLTIPYNIW